MKNMKRTLMITVALIMMFALAACDGDTTPSNGDTAPSNGDTTPSNGDTPDASGDSSIPMPPSAADTQTPDKAVTTMVCRNDKGFAGVAIVFHEEWGEGFTLEASDITDFTVYVNDTPYTGLGFFVVEWPEVLSESEFSYSVAAYHMWLDEALTEHPAEYRVSLVVKGVELTRDDFPTFIIDEDGNFSF